MPATILIDQVGLPAGVAGVARTDGLDTGAVVTLESVGGGSTHRFQFLWVPDDDVNAEASLAPTVDPAIWTFTPTAGSASWGTYRIELITDEGLPTESRSIRIFGIRTAVQGLLIPALNERSDPRASLVLDTAEYLDASENNEPSGTGPFVAGSYGGWYPALRETILAVETGGGGGGGSLQAAYEGGSTIAITAAEGSVAISNAADATHLLTLSRSFVGAGSLIAGTMAAGTTAAAIALTVQAGVAGVTITDGAAAFAVRATQAIAPIGTAAVPSYSFLGALTTGHYLTGTGELAASVGGVVRESLSTTEHIFAVNANPDANLVRNLGSSSFRWNTVFAGTINATTFTGITLQQAYVGDNAISVTAAEGSPSISCTTAADATNLLTLTRNHTGTGGGLIAGTMHTAGTGAGISVTMAATPAGGSRAFDAVSSGSNTFDAYRVTGSSVVLNIRPNEISLSTGTTWTLSIGATSKLSFNATGVLVQSGQILQVAGNGTAGAPSVAFTAIGTTHGFYSLAAAGVQPDRVGISGAPGLMAAEFASRTGASSGTPILNRFQFTDVTTSTAGWTMNEWTRLGSGTGSGTKKFLSVLDGATEVLAIANTGALTVAAGTPPTIVFSNDADSGLGSSAAATISIYSNGSARFTVTSGSVTSVLEHYFPDGSAATPSISNTGDADTGRYFPAANTIADTTGGTRRFQISTTEITHSLATVPEVDNTIALGSASLRWSNLFAVTTTIGDLVLRDPRGAPGHWILREGDGAIWAFDVEKRKKYRLAMEEVEPDASDLARMTQAAYS